MVLCNYNGTTYTEVSSASATGEDAIQHNHRTSQPHVIDSCREQAHGQSEDYNEWQLSEEKWDLIASEMQREREGIISEQ